jgi:hypothetical protein
MATLPSVTIETQSTTTGDSFSYGQEPLRYQTQTPQQKQQSQGSIARHYGCITRARSSRNEKVCQKSVTGLAIFLTLNFKPTTNDQRLTTEF